MNTSLYANTPSVRTLDNRGLTVRDIAWYRHPEALGNTEERITRYRYNARGMLVQSVDPRLSQTGAANITYLTDLAGTVLRMESADAGTVISVNDVASRPAFSVNAAESVCKFQYENPDLPGRLLSITEQGIGQAPRITERFVYAGSSLQDKGFNLAGQCVRHYDTAGLKHTESIALNGTPLSITRQLPKGDENTLIDWQGDDVSAWNDLLATEAYTTLTVADATGNVLTTTDASGNLQRVAYDVAGMLSASWLTVKGGKEQIIVKSLTYSAAGQKLREEHGNGVVTTYTYEAETQRLTGIKTERPAGHPSGAKILQDLRYAYDPVGNVLSIRNDAEETRFWRNQQVVPERTFTYDSLYQLVSATGREMANAGQQSSTLPSFSIFDNATYTHYTRNYTYDAAGNLTQIRHSAPASGNRYTTKITVSDRSNRGVLSTLTEDPAAVDALFTAGGQQKQLQPGQTLSWTPRNELQKVEGESYRYDAASQRILKVSTQSTLTRRVIYLPGLELRTTANGGTETENLQMITVGAAGRAQVCVLHWASGKPDTLDNDPLRYSYNDLTGSSGLELDADGNIISMEEYYPYGGTAVWAARSEVEAGYKTVRYSGKERDATGLYYYGYRYYQPWVGRWLSADPAGTVDGLNLFRMVRNNPLFYVDLEGCAPVKPEINLVDEMLAAISINRNVEIKPMAPRRDKWMLNQLCNFGGEGGGDLSNDEKEDPVLASDISQRKGDEITLKKRNSLEKPEESPMVKKFKQYYSMSDDFSGYLFDNENKSDQAIHYDKEFSGSERPLSLSMDTGAESDMEFLSDSLNQSMAELNRDPSEQSVLASYQAKLQEYYFFRHAGIKTTKVYKDVGSIIIQRFR